MKKPFWEDSYKRSGKLDTFGGGKPSKNVVDIASRMPSGSDALDLGCGEGRNALYLVSIGINTVAVDISESGIEKLKFMAEQMNLNVDAHICDIRTFEFGTKYDLIVCQGTLHLILRHE